VRCDYNTTQVFSSLDHADSERVLHSYNRDLNQISGIFNPLIVSSFKGYLAFLQIRTGS